MGECSNVQALEKISSEVDESQIKIILSSHCIKAQAFLVDKLRKQSERQKEICNYMSKGNVKLEAEIKQAEQEMQSLRSSYDAIRSANVEFRKELLLAKENKIEIEEHVRLGEQKYENLWLECKSRYESIPYVQKLLQTTVTAKILSENINALKTEAQSLINDIHSKKVELKDLDRKRVIEMANFFVNEVPVTMKIIKEKSNEIQTITRELASAKERTAATEIVTVASAEENKVVPQSADLNVSNTSDNWCNLYSIAHESLPIPKLRLAGTDFDALNAKLDQIKIKKVELMKSSPVKRADSEIAEDETTTNKKPKKFGDNVPYYFSKPVSIEDSIDTQVKCNFSNRKLINILEDIKLDNKDTYQIVSHVNLDNLKGVDCIGAEVATTEEIAISDKDTNPIESEQIEEIDLTHGNSEDIAVPPTQFMDYTQGTIIHTSQQAVAEGNENNGNSLRPKYNSQENIKKRVSFDLPCTVEIIPIDEENYEVEQVETERNKTASSELDISGVSDDGFTKIRDMILKKHNLDLSPQFVYTKNTATKMRNEQNITSKFFQQSKVSVSDVRNSNVPHVDEENFKDKLEEIEMKGSNENVKNIESIADCSVKIPSQKVENSVSGFLFKHGANEIPDSLNVSISTTGFEDGEADFPHCLDSSLLLSPKADVPMPMSGENAEVMSQEVPNFLSGLRKTGLSFFGLSSAQKDCSENNEQNTSNNFNFNFGGDEKKNRGGLFSMFR